MQALTSLHFTSLHFTSLHFTSLHTTQHNTTQHNTTQQKANNMKKANIEKRLKNAIAKFRKESQNLKTKKAKKELIEKLLNHIFKGWEIEKIPQTFLNCQIVCRVESSRNGFKHICEMLYSDFFVRFSNKRFYLNRTWEKFHFESVFKEMVYKFAKNQLEREI